MGMQIHIEETIVKLESSKALNSIKFPIKNVSGYTPRLIVYKGNDTSSAILVYSPSALLKEGDEFGSIGLYNHANPGTIPVATYYANVIYSKIN